MNRHAKLTAGSIEDSDDLEKASLDTVYAKLSVSPEGMTWAEAKARIEKYGRKGLVDKEATDLEKFLRFFWGTHRLDDRGRRRPVPAGGGHRYRACPRGTSCARTARSVRASTAFPIC